MAKTNARRDFLKRILKGGACAAGVLAVPASMQKVLAGNGGNSDLDILNFALTLEHLEYAFYRDAVGPIFTYNDFAPYFARDLSAYDAFLLIKGHERDHVQFLTRVIEAAGGKPVPEAQYDFGSAYEDVGDFVDLAQVFENTGVMAYDGAVALISNPAYITGGATIATVEARHASYLNLISTLDVPFPDAFDNPASMEDIIEAVSPFIVG